MADGVAVVTDSTAYLPPDLVAGSALTVVPLNVVVGGRSLAEGVEVTSAEVAEALRSWKPVTLTLRHTASSTLALPVSDDLP